MRRDGLAGAFGSRIYRSVALTAGSGLLFLGLLAGQLQSVDPGRVLAAVGQCGGLPLVASGLATWISFRAVAGYDLALHRHLATGVAPYRARRAGFAAIAIGQTVGMGVLSGALVRWRLLPELGLLGAARLSLLVALSFLASWMLLTAVVLCLLPSTPLAGIAPWVLGGSGLAWALVVIAPRTWLPNLITLVRLVVLAAADCGAAALALWVLMPVGTDPAAFLAAFLLALGAGLVSGSPAGLGAFELVFLALLSGPGHEPVLAAILVWRSVYHAAPALIAAGVAILAWGEPDSPPPPVALPEQAEAGLAAQGLLQFHPAGFLAGRTRHGLVALAAVADLARFRTAARDEGRWPILYKAGPRSAAQARRQGLVALPVAREAWLRPMDFRLDIPARSGLRRKLRRAKAAGVTATIEPSVDGTALARVNAAWVTARGGEYGFSMGRFDPSYCAGQQVIVARKDGLVVGFATFHVARIRGECVWTLDLLRPDPGAAEGTAQLLVVAGLEAARAAGAGRLSLAAVPIGCAARERGAVARLGRWLAPASMTGLMQFKAAFVPDWQRLYIAGPSHLALLVVGWEIWRQVRRPSPLCGMSPATRKVAEYEIATASNPWQRGRDRIA